MSIPEACAALSGWRFESVAQRDAPPLCRTWDFFDPSNEKSVLRVIFIDGTLVAWGVPASDDATERHTEPQEDESLWKA